MEDQELEAIKIRAATHYCEYCKTYVDVDEWFDNHFICPSCGQGE